jgi:hypothetical protein
VMKSSQGPRRTNGVTHLKKVQKRTKTCQDYTTFFGGGGGVLKGGLFIDFLIEQRTINAAYYLRLLKNQVKPPAFRSKRRGRSVKSVCLHENARLHTAAVTTGTLEKMHWEVLPHAICSSRYRRPVRKLLDTSSYSSTLS